MDFRKHQPIYMQIADVILSDILERKISDGDRIPSVRELAISLEVNPNTVQRSYQWLQDVQIIFQKRGIGFFLSDKVYEKTMEVRKEEYLRDELPNTLRTGKLLNVGIETIANIYEKL
ncbi:MAG: GntR family transcriptional regulator [Saprospiraceae bacterium]|nr:GntR family transcriptional regulator [Saprospiraceae bacterium]